MRRGSRGRSSSRSAATSIPVAVGNSSNLRLHREADVVHEPVEPAERSTASSTTSPERPARRGRRRRAALRRSRARAAAARDDSRAFLDEQPRCLEADPAGRARDDADLPAPVRDPRAATLATSTRPHPARAPRRDRLEPRAQVQGHADPPLNEPGHAQAAALVDELIDTRIDAVYSSDLARAHDTARGTRRSRSACRCTDPGCARSRRLRGQA